MATTIGRQSSEGKNAIVTGSSQGIGRAIALRLAADGYNVCVNDIAAKAESCDEVVKEIKAMGRKACTAIADVTKEDQVRDMIQTCVNELGPLNTMVANAGIARAAPLLETSADDMQSLYSINLFGLHNCDAAAARQMMSQGTCTATSPGKLIGASSVAGFKPLTLLGHYSATKFAVRGLTQAYAMELAEHHITANAYAPGIIGTPLWRGIEGRFAEGTSLAPADVVPTYARQFSALGRVGTPEDVARLVSFLASSDSDYVTGQTQLVDGGLITT